MIPNYLKALYERNALEIEDLRKAEEDREEEQKPETFGPRALSPYPHTGD